MLKQVVFRFSLFLILLLCFSNGAMAHFAGIQITDGNLNSQKETIEIFRTAEAPIIDGNYDDLWDFIDEVPIKKQFNNEFPSVEAYWKAMYDEENIYLYLHVTDNEHLPAWEVGAGNHWEYDKPEVYFDVNKVLNDGVGGRNSGDGHWQFAVPFSENQYGVPYFGGDMRKPVFSCYQKVGEGYRVEYAFPYSAMPQADGTVLDMQGFKNLPEGIGFDITIIDRDSNHDRRHRMVWQNAGFVNESYNNMDDCGVIKLVDIYAGASVVAKAGPSQTVMAGNAVMLNGSASFSRNGDVLQYQWSAPDGIVLNSNTLVNPSFIAPNVDKPTVFTLSLVVSNGSEYSNSSQVIITVNPEVKVLYPADKPNISVNHGFYNQPFDVTISSAVAGMRIYYTLDGSDPSTSLTAVGLNAPAQVRIDPQSTSKRGKTPAVTLRAVAIKDEYSFSAVVTRTYIFNKQLALQTEYPGHDWPSSQVNDQRIDLSVDGKVLNDSRYKNDIEEAMTQVPTFSIVTDNANLFDPSKGIYVNALSDGAEWERPASIELINPDGTKGFQIDAGLRIRGGYSRNSHFSKHAFRLFFRKEYGEGKLDYALFEDEGVKKFDKVDLRCSQNYSWHRSDGESQYSTYNRDVFSRDVQRAMGQPYTRSRYYHLYLNGMYWGLYQTQERSEARFAESYFGGTSDDYDVVKKGDSGIEATDGNLDAWREVWNITQKGYTTMPNYYKIEGLDNSGKRDLSVKKLVDVDNLIDYMNIIFYTGNFDAPVGAWSNNKSVNNFYTIYNRNGMEGFKFFAHDSEHSLLIDPIGPGIGITENRVDLGTRSGNMRMQITSFNQFNPQWLHHKLTSNEEYRMRFADRAYRYYHNEGILTPEKTAELFLQRSLEYDMAIIGESARWGYLSGWTTYTKDEHWKPIIERTLNKYFPYRSDIVIAQLKAEKLLPSIDAPEIRVANKIVKTEEVLMALGGALDIRNSNSSGDIIFTVDGNDPRQVGGAISPSAVNGGNLYTINFHQSAIVKARVYSGSEWSTLSALRVNVDEYISGIQITEIHYNPLGSDGFAGSQYEFIELKNVGISAVTLTNASFVNGIQYSFNTETVLQPGKFIVLASQSFTFKLRYGFEPFGQYIGQLDNSGEQITLVSATGQVIAAVKYNDKLPWPTSADGLGFSIVPVSSNLDSDWNEGTNWRASSVIQGTPGADDQGSDIPEIWVNEVIASSDKPEVDAVELYNPNGYDVDISHWFLSDNRKLPQKWQIPVGTIIPARKYLVFYEGVYEGETKTYTTNNFGNAFSFSSHGDDVYLFSGNASGNLTGYEHGYEFGESENSISFGRYTTSEKDIHFVLMENQTLGAANSHPKVGPIIVNRIMYHPFDNHFEYIELVNISDSAVELFDLSINRGWRVSGVNFDFANGVSVQSGESVFLTESAIHPEDFRGMMGIDQQTQIFNYSGKLDNAGERIEIRKPAPSYTKVEEDTTYIVYPHIVVETINYNDKAPWPDADGNGFALKRKVQTRYANDPANWIALPAGISVQNFILANAVEGVQYQHQFLATGGLSPYVWNIASGSLPTGLTLDASKGTISGIPVQNGAFSFKMLVADQFGVDVPIEISLNVDVNTLPVALNDTISTQELFSATVYVFENDIDNDGEKAQWGLNVVANPKHGTFKTNNDQSITYFPNNGFAGTDELTYRIIDYKGTADAKMVIKVEPEMLIGNVLVGISQASDDAEENIYSHNFWANSSDIEMVYDPNPGGDQIVGFRFAQVAVPAGAIITRAYIQFKADQVSTQAVSLIVNAEAASNPPTFSTSNLISSRVLTSASVNWEPEPWNMIGETSEKQQTPNLSALVSEVVKRDNWQSGNAMAFIISGTGTRVAVAYDKDTEAAAQLFIEYRTAYDEATVPFAIADVSETVIINNLVELFGFDSYSADKRKLNYDWSLISKPNNSQSVLSNRYVANPTFIPDNYGNYSLSLVVNNGVYSSEATIINVVVTNSQPVANAGYDQQKKVGDQIMLNGSNSYDPEGESIEFSWSLIEKPVGSNAYIDGVKLEKPLLVTDMAGIYRVHLVVNDGFSNSATDEAVVEVGINLKPVAVVNVNQEVYIGELVQLSGDGSYDPEGKNISYTWSVLSKPTNSNLVLSNNSAKSPSFIVNTKGVYTFSLVVSDGVNQSNAVETIVTVINNNPPVADAGENIQVDKGQSVTFNGSNSYDPDGTLLSYLWTFITKPEGSKATLSNYAIVNPVFVPDKDGLYTLRLQVSDGIASSFADVQLVVNPLNSITTFSSDLTMRVYPNPFGERLYIETQRVETSAITCQLFTISGMLLEQIELYPNGTSTHQLSFDRSRLHEGIYLLTVKSDKSEPQTVRVVYRKMND